MENRVVDSGVFFNPSDIVFMTSEDAHEALTKLNDIIITYTFATINDICELAGVAPMYIYSNYGWSSIDSALVKKTRDGYYIDLPKPVLLDKTFGERVQKPDMVNHPPHYQSETGMEVIDVIEAFTFDLKGIEAVCTANVLKYICRWHNKNGVQDLKKAKWYLERLINHIENLEKENM